MCGIAGIVGLHDKDNVRNMLEFTRHRGPDDYGLFSNESITIGMNRLSIIDLSKAGHQPMISKDGRFVIVYNGEMYNYKQEREMLLRDGIVFNSNTDTEVVLYLYLKFREKCLDRIRGMFSFAIWDNNNNELFAARDRLGIKPFLYSLKDATLTFCSEIKGMLANPNIEKNLDISSVEQFLTLGFISAPSTIIKNIYSLLPGHFLNFKKGNLTINKYWDFEDKPVKNISYQDACEGIRNLVMHAVKEQMISDVPIGLFLSGGLDSSIIAASLANSGYKNVNSFSISFYDITNTGNEISEAKEVSNFFKTNHNAMNVSSTDISDNFPLFISALDQPSIDGINTYFISKFTKGNATVALSGLGGDELFLGYSNHRFILHNLYKYRNLIEFIKPTYKIFRAYLPLNISNSLDYKFSYSDFSEFYTFVNRIQFPIQVNKILKPEFQSINGINIELLNRYSIYQLNKPKSLVNKITKADCKIFMGSRLLRDSDCTSMIHSLEVRYPLLDHRLVEFVYSLPDVYKINQNSLQKKDKFNFNLNFKNNNVKILLLDSFIDIMPKDFSQRSKKGFIFPYKDWVENVLIDRYRELLNDNKFIFNNKYIENSNNLNQWALLILWEWCKTNKINY